MTEVTAAEFAEYQRLKVLRRRVYRASELSEEAATALRATQMNTMHDHLNTLLDD